MSVLVGLSLTNHCLDHSEIFFKSVFTMLHKLFISYDFSPMYVSSANNLHNPIVSSAMSCNHVIHDCAQLRAMSSVMTGLNKRVI